MLWVKLHGWLLVVGYFLLAQACGSHLDFTGAGNLILLIGVVFKLGCKGWAWGVARARNVKKKFSVYTSSELAGILLLNDTCEY